MTNRPRLQYVGGSLSKARSYESPVRDMLCTTNVDLAQPGVNPRSRQRVPMLYRDFVGGSGTRPAKRRREVPRASASAAPSRCMGSDTTYLERDSTWGAENEH